MAGERARAELEESLHRLQREQRRQLQLLGGTHAAAPPPAALAADGDGDGSARAGLDFSRALCERTNAMMMTVDGAGASLSAAGADGAGAARGGHGRYFTEALAGAGADGGAVLPVLSCLHSAIESTSAQHAVELLMWEGAWKRMCALVSTTIVGTKAATDAFKSNMAAMQTRHDGARAARARRSPVPSPPRP